MSQYIYYGKTGPALVWNFYVFELYFSSKNYSTLFSWPKHKCNICEYSAITALGLQKHMRSHFGKSFKCAICKYSCSKAGDLKKHNRRHHAGKKPNTCMNELTFSELIDLHRHCRTHTGEEPDKCKFCDFETGNVGSHKLLKKKRKRERLYKCKICSYVSKASNKLRKHMKKHAGDKNI